MASLEDSVRLHLRKRGVSRRLWGSAKYVRRMATRIVRLVADEIGRTHRAQMISERVATHGEACDNICRCGYSERAAARARMRVERRAGVRRRLKRRGWC